MNNSFGYRPSARQAPCCALSALPNKTACHAVSVVKARKGALPDGSKTAADGCGTAERPDALLFLGVANMISTIKFLSVIGVAGWMLFGSHTAHAQIPVTDGASIGQQIAAQVETIAKWKLQYDQTMSQD